MKYRENERRELDLRAKVIIVASIIVSFFVALVPVWQKGVTRQNHYELIIAKEKLERMEEEEKNLMAYILQDETTDGEKTTEFIAGV